MNTAAAPCRQKELTAQADLFLVAQPSVGVQFLSSHWMSLPMVFRREQQRKESGAFRPDPESAKWNSLDHFRNC